MCGCVKKLVQQVFQVDAMLVGLLAAIVAKMACELIFAIFAGDGVLTHTN
jgi:cell division protein FtsX